jgi:hypothetical protein
MGEDHPDVLEFLTLLVGARHVQNRAVLGESPSRDPLSHELS